jgi:RNA polymerase subunit RPABC4/transcription elongation factor Spt4
MAEDSLTCRHCGRAIVVPASNCPWCGERIFVICASCKQYTDDQAPLCQHCGAPLVADTMEEVRTKVGLDADVAQLVADRERAQLVASGVLAQYASGFFFDDGQRRTVLTRLFGAPLTPFRETAALLFVAIVYLVQQGYCALQSVAGGKGLNWVEVRPWDGQARSLEGALAQRAGVDRSIRQVVDEVVGHEMGFRFGKTRASRLHVPGTPRLGVRDLSERSATMAVVGLARATELPAHQEVEACGAIYRLALAFVQADPERAEYLAGEIGEVLDWFRRYEEDPTLAVLR